MIVEKVLGKLGDAAFAGRAADVLDIEWYNANKRIDRKMTRGGKEVGIRMDHRTSHTGFTQDDVLHDDGTEVITVNIIPCECIYVRIDTAAGTFAAGNLAAFCYEVGNRHAPFYYGESENDFLMPYEEPLKEVIAELGLSPEKTEARLLPEKKVSARGHGHSH
ncbi:MAG: urease accessory protein UreE [Spirochaetes bacterium]|nr:urease accessory protein UreE [Spirochaetota bacterium]